MYFDTEWITGAICVYTNYLGQFIFMFAFYVLCFFYGFYAFYVCSGIVDLSWKAVKLKLLYRRNPVSDVDITTL